ncbi:cell division protein FtsQ/DivIB [Bartonella senegalensis]|uniref:cell division protein FtsQ/DivIB n=1 Tax=Bartonella senegalensis TaxID=1468418 RepID=UPI0002E7FF35|nr:cell division protein FtsQ/DivIB [Bartonella senegalensis]
MYALNVDKTNVPMVVFSVPVLPRLYRRFFRFMFEFVFVRVHVPRHFGSFAVLFFFSLTLLYGLSLSGRMEVIVKTALSDIGFMITDVDMSGNKRVVKQDILKLLGLDAAASSIFTFDVERARSLLEQQAWIQSANVQKIYPNRVRILVVERKPYAIWQHDGMVDIVDSTGRVIVPFQAGVVQNLPLIVGQGAQNAAKGFLQALSVYPKIYGHVRAYVRVGDRRWDLILDNGMRVMLPENGAFERLDSLIKSGVVKDLFSRDVLRVDLRLSDRITVALSDEALERHRAFVAEKEERVLNTRKAGKL